MQGGFDNRLDFFQSDLSDLVDATRTWSILFQPHKTKSQKPLPPELDRWFADTQIASDLLALHIVCSHPNNPGKLFQFEICTPESSYLYEDLRKLYVTKWIDR